MEIREKVVIKDRLGLHLRAAAELVKAASKFKCRIKVEKNSQTADAKSLMNLIALAAPYGTELTLAFEGVDAWTASREIGDLFKRGFRELEMAAS
jgi:phosphocarrier protein